MCFLHKLVDNSLQTFLHLYINLTQMPQHETITMYELRFLCIFVFMSANLKDYFLGSPMLRPDFMKVHISKLPTDIIDKYNLKQKMDEHGYVYIKINKGMYGLKQATVLAYQRLVVLLGPHVYYPEKYTTGIWAHKTRKTKFCLCVDDFGIKHFTTEDAKHVLATLKKYYNISTD